MLEQIVVLLNSEGIRIFTAGGVILTTVLTLRAAVNWYRVHGYKRGDVMYFNDKDN